MKYKPYKYNGKTLVIERYVVLNSTACTPEEYDIFSLEPDKNAVQMMEKINNSDDLQLFDDMDRGMFNTFRYIEDCQNKKYSLYARIYSEKDVKVVISITASMAKLWINGKCTSIHPEMSVTNYYQTAELKKGMNDLIFEQFCYKPDNRFLIRIRDFEYEMANEIDSLSQVIQSVKVDPFILVHDPFYCPNSEKFKFMYFNNSSEYKANYEIEVSDSVNGVVDTLYGKINQPKEIELSGLRNLDNESFRHERFLCKMINSQNKIEKIYFCVFPNVYLNRVGQIKKKLMSKAVTQSAQIYEQARGEVQKLEKNLEAKNYTSGYWDLYRCNELLKSIEKRNLENYSYKLPGTHQVYIRSKLDDSPVKIGIRIPSDYDESKKYPTFIAIASAGDGQFCRSFPPESEIDEKCLCFDVSGRGYTAGSYLGQASILEILDWIKKEFSVDEDRLYFIGYSNGGFGVYSVAQNFPHIPASIYPLAGYPQIKTIKNITNIPTYQIVSTNDYLFSGRKNEVKNKIKEYGNYFQYDVKKINHYELSVQLQNKQILNQMLKHRRNKYPRNIQFKTCRNRNLKSYWVKIHGISKTKQWGNITARITDSGNIEITASGITGLTVTLPSEIDRQRFSIVINKKEFAFRHYSKDKVSFKKGRTWKISDEEIKTDVCKGNGLLDVYTNRLRIFVPNNFNDQMLKCAQSFSHPQTNGFFPEVYVNYPIHSENDVCQNVFDYNLIVFDINNNCRFTKKFKELLPVKCRKTGFAYQNSFKKGDYVVMQVIPNPYNNELSILSISTNNAELLKKHILLRKILIPTYVNGLHKYWNNEALVYDGKDYYAIYEKDAQLTKI